MLSDWEVSEFPWQYCHMLVMHHLLTSWRHAWRGRSSRRHPWWGESWRGHPWGWHAPPHHWGWHPRRHATPCRAAEKGRMQQTGDAGSTCGASMNKHTKTRTKLYPPNHYSRFQKVCANGKPLKVNDKWERRNCVTSSLVDHF